MKEAVVIPIYNEASTVAAVLDAVRAHYDGLVIVVDDGSTDGTAALLAARRDVTVLTHPTNQGYGRSILDGFAAARRERVERVVTMDSDGQHEPSHLRPFLEAVRGGADMVSGSRYLPTSKVVGVAPAARMQINRRFTAHVNEATGFGITDAFCGLRSLGPRALHATESLSEPGYGILLELWALAHARGLRVVEHAVERIYFDAHRSFGADLDDPVRRGAYYLRVWERARAAFRPAASEERA